ncbi:MAG: RluA family pseudouridine synthase [Acutalibacteraceae bacterium]|nr:RluA family pseudouridine synthase [Acutalibacteraceae bacterium]
MKEFIISANDSGQRLDKFISKAMPLLPKALMYKYIRTKHIKLNGKRAEISTRLNTGDKVNAYISDEFFGQAIPKYDFLSAGDKLNIVYEDENILLADKPQGLLSHPDENEYNDTLITRIQKYLYNKGEYRPDEENSFKPSLANRIDRNTGGIVIAAKNAQALRILCDKIKTREIDKRYLTVVHGIPKEKEALLEGFLEKNESKNKVYLQNKKTEKNLTVKTFYRTLAKKNGLALLEIELLTGRTHQIRAHLSSIGHALLGDGKYGKLKEDKKMGFTKQALYSYKLTFSFESDADILNYLKNKTFTVDEVWFAKELFGYEIK